MKWNNVRYFLRNLMIFFQTNSVFSFLFFLVSSLRKVVIELRHHKNNDLNEVLRQVESALGSPWSTYTARAVEANHGLTEVAPLTSADRWTPPSMSKEASLGKSVFKTLEVKIIFKEKKSCDSFFQMLDLYLYWFYFIFRRSCL